MFPTYVTYFLAETLGEGLGPVVRSGLVINVMLENWPKLVLDRKETFMIFFLYCI